MSFCISPRCAQPDHPRNDGSQFCQSCGSELLLLGRYRVMRLISDKSGFGRVYEAFDRSTPKILKVLKETLSHNAKAVALFQQEAVVLSQLPHAGIPAIEPQSYFQFQPRNLVDPLHCIIMEKIDGPNLREWMRQQGQHPISEKQALNWLKQLAEILHLVHQKNYFHRDIKPENIMLRSSGQLVLVDFGAAREMTFTYLAQLGKSGEITRISSAGYTPPEQEKGQAVPQSDFYALGCTFIYLLTGKPPTNSDIYSSLNNEFYWRKYAPHVSPQFASFIDKLVAPRASDRPKSTQDILTTLSQIEAELAQIPSIPPVTQIPKHTLPPAPTQLQAGSTGASTSSSSDSSGRGSSRRLWLWGGAIALLAAAGYGSWHSYSLQQLSPRIEQASLIRSLDGHSSFINALAISPDGKTLISGSADQTIKVWDAATGAELKTLSGHTSFINALAISPDGKTLASGSADLTVRIWDLASGSLLATLSGHKGFVNALHFSPDGQTLASGSADKTIKLWELATGKELRTLNGHTGFINSLDISPAGQTLVSGSTDQTIKVWELATGKELRTLSGHAGFVNTVLMGTDGQTILSSSTDQTIKVWSLATGEVLKTLTGHTGFVNPLALSSNGQTLVSASADQTIKIWNLTTGTVTHTINCGVDLKHFVVSPDWQTIASGSGSKTIRLWHLTK
ncbi:serine/threonine protein kinase [Phormidium tenue FACHB-886]|nr:serine/threonine protein kinase [Phormidium tenue FACHB-886]